MVSAVSEKTRALVFWVGLGVVVVAAFVATIGILNSTVYSGAGFARSYVDALARGDTRSALELAGVQATDASGDELLGVSQEGRLGDVEVVGERSLPDGSRSVVVRYRPEGGTPATSAFVVRRAGTTGGFFHLWQFQTVPTASIDVTPEHDARFTADGRTITTKGADLASRYTVLVPSVLDLAHSTTYLQAEKVRMNATTVGSVEKATIDVEPRASFVAQVETGVTKYLRGTCLPQRVLLPAGCPFGREIDDRLSSAPTWSMTTYPAVDLQPTSSPGVWRVTTARGEAHLEVGAESLYDGHSYTVDDDVPFTVGYLVTIGADDRLTIKPETD